MKSIIDFELKFRKWQIIICFILMCGILIHTGCSTNQTSVAIKSEGVVVTTVDVGMQAWSIFVKNGGATQAQMDAVRSAYNAYYNSQLISKAALVQMVTSGSTNISDVQQANVVSNEAQTALIDLLNQYLTKK